MRLNALRCVMMLFWLIPLIAFAQMSKQSLILELGGHGGFGALAWESLYQVDRHKAFVLQAGISSFPTDKNNGINFVFPIGIHAIMGDSNHKLDLSLNQILTLSTKGNIYARAGLGIGYRFQKDNHPLFFRLSYSPLISYLFDRQYQHWAGIALGYTFKG